MGSGPRAGLAEIRIPDLQPGSSIMPGKVNPVVCEAVTQVCAQVIGNDAAVAFAGSQGNFELNVYLPVIARNLLESIRLLASVTRLFADRCVAGIEANVDRLKQYAESSPSIGTALNPVHRLREGRRARQGVDEDGPVDPRARARRGTDVRRGARPRPRRPRDDQGRPAGEADATAISPLRADAGEPA